MSPKQRAIGTFPLSSTTTHFLLPIERRKKAAMKEKNSRISEDPEIISVNNSIDVRLTMERIPSQAHVNHKALKSQRYPAKAYSKVVDDNVSLL